MSKEKQRLYSDNQLHHYGARKSKKIKVACLMCGRDFMSPGIHKRRCPKCDYKLFFVEGGGMENGADYLVQYKVVGVSGYYLEFD